MLVGGTDSSGPRQTVAELVFDPNPPQVPEQLSGWDVDEAAGDEAGIPAVDSAGRPTGLSRKFERGVRFNFY